MKQNKDMESLCLILTLLVSAFIRLIVLVTTINIIITTVTCY